MAKLNQVSGIVALVAMACLLFFNGSENYAVTPAIAQPSVGGGGTGTPITLGGCNRCAWEFRYFQFPNSGVHDVYLVPQGTTGAVMSFGVSGAAVPYLNSYDPSAPLNQIFPTTQTNGWPTGNFVADRNPEGLRFHDGVRFQIQGSAEIWIAFRVD